MQPDDGYVKVAETCSCDVQSLDPFSNGDADP
jgi:hypothetical protein